MTSYELLNLIYVPVRNKLCKTGSYKSTTFLSNTRETTMNNFGLTRLHRAVWHTSGDGATEWDEIILCTWVNWSTKLTLDY